MSVTPWRATAASESLDAPDVAGASIAMFAALVKPIRAALRRRARFLESARCDIISSGAALRWRLVQIAAMATSAQSKSFEQPTESERAGGDR